MSNQTPFQFILLIAVTSAPIALLCLLFFSVFFFAPVGWDRERYLAIELLSVALSVAMDYNYCQHIIFAIIANIIFLQLCSIIYLCLPTIHEGIPLAVVQNCDIPKFRGFHELGSASSSFRTSNPIAFQNPNDAIVKVKPKGHEMSAYFAQWKISWASNFMVSRMQQWRRYSVMNAIFSKLFHE